MIKYKENWGSFLNKKDQEILFKKNICLLGVGGNGGYLLDYLIRLGIKKISCYDGDIFEESNLNRQIYCNQKTLGMSKILSAQKYTSQINPDIKIKYYNHSFSEKDLKKYDIIIDCADNLSKTTLEYIKHFNVPFLENCNLSIGSLITIIDKEHKYYIDNIIKSLNYPKQQDSQPAYLCALTASLACSEMVKFFLNKPCAIGYELIYNIINNSFERNYY